MTMRERIEDLREWATTRARDASSAQAESMQTIAEQLALAKLGLNDDDDDEDAGTFANTPVPISPTPGAQNGNIGTDCGRRQYKRDSGRRWHNSEHNC